MDFKSKLKLPAAGYLRNNSPETKQIIVISRGRFMLYLVTYYNRAQEVSDFLELVWDDVRTGKYPLDMVSVNWPAGHHKIADVESSIVPNGIDETGTITVTFLKTSGSASRTYKYNSERDNYTPS